MTACRLYLISPPALPDDFPALLQAACAAGDIAALRLHLPGADPAAIAQAVAAIRPVTLRYDVALILAGDAALARQLGCDGVHLDGSTPDVPAARSAAGDDLQLGVSCGFSRDAAMQAGEDGADYVTFGPYVAPEDDTSLLTWWAELMELPVVAEGANDVQAAAALARAGADFVALGGDVWAEPAAHVRDFIAQMEAP